MKKLEGRDRLSPYKISEKLNEIIDVLTEKDILPDKGRFDQKDIIRKKKL